jgi:ribosomal 50S subunit-recycling heat shock protein
MEYQIVNHRSLITKYPDIAVATLLSKKSHTVKEERIIAIVLLNHRSTCHVVAWPQKTKPIEVLRVPKQKELEEGVEFFNPF